MHRYVGNLRALNAGLLDAYLLKSLDGASEDPPADTLVMVRCAGGSHLRKERAKVCMFKKEDPQPNSTGAVELTVTPGWYSPHDAWAKQLVADLRHLKLLASDDPIADTHTRIGVGLSGSRDHLGKRVLASADYPSDVRQIRVFASALLNESMVEDLAEFGRRGGTPEPLVYDRVIRCLGWRHAMDMYTDSTRPHMQHNRKYAAMTPEYESVNVPGLFFAGQLAHGKDYRRSAGGFIHGFRYTARALFRILEARYNQAPWPSTHYTDVTAWDDGGLGLGPSGCNAGDWGADPCTAPVTPTSDFERLLIHTFARINTASGPYQMVGVLGDGVVFRCPGGTATGTVDADYYEEMPFPYFNERFRSMPRLFWHFGYGEQARSLHKSRSEGTMFQVHVWFYPGDCSSTPPEAVRPPVPPEVAQKEVLKLYETLHTQWDTWDLRARVGEWLQAKVSALRPGVLHAPAEAWGPPPEPPTPDYAACPSATVATNINECLQKANDPEAYKCLSVPNALGDLPWCACLAASPAVQACMGPCWPVMSDLYGCARAADAAPTDKSAAADPPRPSSRTVGNGARKADVSWTTWSGESDTMMVDWEGGRVDVLIFNNHTQAVQVMHKTSFDQGQEPVLEHTLTPGSGVRFVSHEREQWFVLTRDGTQRAAWTIDIGNGILQDLIVR